METVRHNLRSSSNSIARRARRGFNLIEAAIVLGVVGLVIGGIWVGAVTVIENYNVNKTVEGVFSTARNIQNLISVRDSVAIGNNINITNAVIDSGGYPKDWINGSNVTNLFGGDVVVTNLSGDASGERFSLVIYQIPFAACIKLLVRASSISYAAGGKGIGSGQTATGSNFGSLLRIVLNNNYVFSVFPINPADAETRCNVYKGANGKVGGLYFIFSYSRN